MLPSSESAVSLRGAEAGAAQNECSVMKHTFEVSQSRVIAC